MASRYPWFKFYATDWLSDPFVRCLSAAQRGVYIDLLAYAWQEGGIYRDPRLIRRLLGIPAVEPESPNPDEWADWVPVQDLEDVLDAFTADLGNGRWSHPKLESCRADKAAESESASAAGRASAEARRRKSKASKRTTRRSTGVQRAANHSESELDSEPEPKGESIPPLDDEDCPF